MITFKQINEIKEGQNIHYISKTQTARDGLIMEIRNNTDVWYGMFGKSKIIKNGLNKILNLKDSNYICVISGGKGYIVNLLKPTNINFISLEPLFGGVVYAIKEQMIIWGNYSLGIISKNGNIRIVNIDDCDEIKSINLVDDGLNVLYYDLKSEDFINKIIKV